MSASRSPRRIAHQCCCLRAHATRFPPCVCPQGPAVLHPEQVSVLLPLLSVPRVCVCVLTGRLPPSARSPFKKVEPTKAERLKSTLGVLLILGLLVFWGMSTTPTVDVREEMTEARGSLRPLESAPKRPRGGGMLSTDNVTAPSAVAARTPATAADATKPTTNATVAAGVAEAPEQRASAAKPQSGDSYSYSDGQPTNRTAHTR